MVISQSSEISRNIGFSEQLGKIRHDEAIVFIGGEFDSNLQTFGGVLNFNLYRQSELDF
jgi:hypothetical protein